VPVISHVLLLKTALISPELTGSFLVLQ